MEEETCAVGSTFFIPKSGLDAANYIVIATQVKVAAHEEVQAQHLHFIDDLRSIIHLHIQQSRSEVTGDGLVQKSTSRDVIEQMDCLLQRLDAAGFRLCFRMWSISTAQELVRMALADAEAVDTDGNFDEAQPKGDDNRYGAIVAFLIVPHSLPVMIPSRNDHPELCITEVPDWDELPNELAEV